MIHDSQVVCPQCLAVCRYINGALVVRDDSDAPYRHTANVDSSKLDSSKFCHSCGKQLPSGISFCPYCGADLSAPFSKTGAATAPQRQAPAPVQEAPKPQPAPKVEQPKPEPRQMHNNEVEEKLRTMSRTQRYNGNGMPRRLHQNGTMPSKPFKIVAYLIIALLLVLLVFIIKSGLSLEPAI